MNETSIDWTNWIINERNKINKKKETNYRTATNDDE